MANLSSEIPQSPPQPTPAERLPRVPQPIGSIQVNHCKSPKCANFFRPASPDPPSRGRNANPERQDTYRRCSSKGGVSLHCKLCGETFTMKSNEGIYEEYLRLTKYPAINRLLACTNKECPNYRKDFHEYPDLYIKGGYTKAGSQRFQCRTCKETFSFSRPKKSTARQKKGYLNSIIFRALVNKSPIRGISEICDIPTKTVRDKIDFIYKQCCKFIEARESVLFKEKKLKKLYISVDQQFYSINWNVRKDKRNVILYGAGAADNKSGYVLAMDVNYNPWLDSDAIEKDAESCGDYNREPAFRRYGHLWLYPDFDKEYKEALKKDKKRNRRKPKAAPVYESAISARYRKVVKRRDIDSPEEVTEAMQLPRHGMMVHLEYSLYAMFFRLREMLKGAEKVRFFMDQESPIRAACLSAFRDRLLGEPEKRTFDAYFVQYDRDKSNDEREKIQKESEKKLKEYAAEHNLEVKDAKLALLLNELRGMKPFGKWSDRWFEHPLPGKKEPNIRVCHLTDIGGYDDPHRAWLYNLASLHGINRYFQHVRRKLSALERSISTPARLGRRWYQYAPYDPALVNKLLTIHRVYYNYIGGRETKKTPAMRFGLASKRLSVDDILYASRMAFSRARTLSLSRKIQPQTLTQVKKPTTPTFFETAEPDPGKTPPDSIRSHQVEHRVQTYPTVFLDVETTGFDDTDEIIEIAILDEDGQVLFKSLVKPSISIPADATKIHGLTNKDVERMPTLKELEPEIVRALRSKHVVTYGGLDVKLLPNPIKSEIKVHTNCIKDFAEYYGQWDDDHESYRWQELSLATEAAGHKWGKGEEGRHRALGDALALRTVWQFLRSHAGARTGTSKSRKRPHPGIASLKDVY